MEKKKQTSMMGIGEVCNRLGIAKWQIYHMINSGAIGDVQKVAGKRIFMEQDIKAIRDVLEHRIDKLQLSNFFSHPMFMYGIDTETKDNEPFKLVITYKHLETDNDKPESLALLKHRLKRCGLSIIKIANTKMKKKSSVITMMVKKMDGLFDCDMFAKIFITERKKEREKQ